jgi:GAF domain-containing protein
MLLERYGEGLGLQRKELKDALRTTDERAQQVGNSLGIFGTGAAGDSLEDGKFFALSAESRRGISVTLSAGVASLGRMLERQQSPDAILTHGVEVLRRAFDFQRVFVCEAERSTGNCRVIRLAGKSLPLEDDLTFMSFSKNDLFSAALLKSADVYIAEAADERIRRALPAWHRAICPDARSFLLLPVASRNEYQAFLYADHARSHSRRPTHDEVQLLMTLKMQVGLALRQAAPAL